MKEKDYQPEEAFDGNLGLRYAAASYESGVTLGVDLGKTYKVSSVAFKWENAYATEYNIQVSKDGKAYDTVKTMTADKAETIEVPLDEAVEARYVRIECVKNAINYGYSLWEMGVYGTEVAEVETTTNTPVVEPGTGETTTPAKQDETTTPAKQDETTTAAPAQNETTTAAPAQNETTTAAPAQNETTTVAPTTKAISTTAAPATVKKTTVKKTTVKATAKKLSSNKVKLSVKKVAGASKYAVQISTTKNFKKVVAKKTSKKAVFTVKSKKLKGKKKLYVRVKVYKKVNGKTVASQWSKATKIKVKK